MEPRSARQRRMPMDYSIPKDVLDAHTQVFPWRVGDAIVFVKKRRSEKNPLGRLVQQVLYRLTGNQLIIPTAKSTESSVDIEVAKIRLLAALDVNVPRLLHVEDDYFVMSHVGPPLNEVLEADPGRARERGERAVAALSELHALGQAHGGAQIKNLTMLDEVIHFIDFEEAIPEEHLEKFQLRDLFLMLLSMERHQQNPDPERLCRIYDGGTRSLTGICDALLGFRMTRLLDSRLFNLLSMRDIRSLNSLIRKAERVAAGKPALPDAPAQSSETP